MHKKALLLTFLTGQIQCLTESETVESLKIMNSNLISFYQKANYQGSPAENYESRGVDGFQWYEGGIFWGIVAEFVRATGDLSHSSIMFSALATASNGVVGSFLGAVPSLAGLSGKWNDDILWWAMGPATSGFVFGAETGLPGGATLRAVASNTWNEVWSTWDSKCGGGLYWSRNQAKSAGYKSTISNVQQMLVGAQLTALTGNQSYLQNSERIYSWLKSSGILTQDWRVYDGIDADENCKMSVVTYSYNAGVLLGALAWMYRVSNNQVYLRDSSSLLTATLSRFAPSNILTDQCEPNCALNTVTFKGALARSLGYMYEFHTDAAVKSTIQQTLTTSVNAMLRLCDSAWNCGNNWGSGTPNPGGKSVHDQMNAVELMTAYYKSFGVSMKSGLPLPEGATPASNGNGVGALPQGAAMRDTAGMMSSLLLSAILCFVL